MQFTPKRFRSNLYFALLPLLIAVLIGGQRPASASPRAAGPGLPEGQIGWLLANLSLDGPGSVAASFLSPDGKLSHVESDTPSCRTSPITDFAPDGDLYARRPVFVDGLAPDLSPIGVGGIIRTDWFAEGRATAAGLGQRGMHFTAPLLLSDFYGQCSKVTIRNVDSAAANVRMFATRVDESTPAWEGEQAVEPFGVAQLDFCAETPPGLERFVGSMILVSDSLIAAWVTSVFEGTSAGHTVAVPHSESASDILYAPIVHRTVNKEWSTGISVANPGIVPADVTVTYHGVGGSCAGERIVHGGGAKRIEPMSSHLFLQSHYDDSRLPDGCIATAEIRAEGGGGVAMVVDSRRETEEAASYLAFSAYDASMSVALPLVRNRHTSAYELITAIFIMNLGTEPTTARIDVIDERGSVRAGCSGCEQVIAPGAVFQFMPGSTFVGVLDRGEVASAVVESDNAPIVAVVVDASYRGGLDTAMYSGLPCRSGRGGRVGLP